MFSRLPSPSPPPLSSSMYSVKFLSLSHPLTRLLLLRTIATIIIINIITIIPSSSSSVRSWLTFLTRNHSLSLSPLTSASSSFENDHPLSLESTISTLSLFSSTVTFAPILHPSHIKALILHFTCSWTSRGCICKEPVSTTTATCFHFSPRSIHQHAHPLRTS